jgi:uncharacterized membrane protein YfcA
MENLLAFVLALLIGIFLGLIGGGGSILTVPVLVYILGISPVTATGYSLFIVGSTALVGAFSYAIKKQIDFKTALIFSPPSFLSVFLVRKYLLPAIPDEIFTVGDFILNKNIFLMLLFAVLMFFAALSMVGKKDNKTEENESGEKKYNYRLIFAEGFLVGGVTGLVGAGGGFLIIPALVILAKLPMRLAVGTSLLIIGVKSLAGFAGDVMNAAQTDWHFLIIFSTAASVGIFAGSFLSKFIAPDSLKRFFGYFLMIMAFYIVGKELF